MGSRGRVLAAVAALVLPLVACGSDDDASDATSPPTTAGSGTATTAGPATTSVPSTTAPMQRYKISIAAYPGSAAGMTPFVALSKGFFAEEGLDVELVTLTNQGTLVSSLESGSTQVIPAVFNDIVSLVQRGSDVQVIAGFNQGVGYKLMTRPGLDIPVGTASDWQKTILALKGKKIGAAGGEISSTAKITQALMVMAGGKAADLTFIPVNAGGPTVAALTAGQVDVAIPDYATAMVAQQQGARTILDLKTDTPKEVREIVFTGFLSSDANLKKYPGLDQRFFRAITKAMEFIKNPANIAEVHKIAVSDAKVPESTTLDEGIKIIAPLLNSKPTKDQLGTTLTFMKTAGLITDPLPPLEDFIAPALLGA